MKYVGFVLVLLLIIGLSCSKHIIEKTKVDTPDEFSTSNPCDEILKYKIERGISSKSTIVCYSGGVEIYRAMLSDKSPADWWQGRWTFMDESRKRKVSTSLECIVYGKKGI